MRRPAPFDRSTNARTSPPGADVAGAAVTPLHYRAPALWGVAGVALVGVAGAGLVVEAVSLLTASVLVVLGAAMVFLRTRAWFRMDDAGISMCPNGLKTFVVAWSEIVGMQGRRLRFVVDGGAREERVTVPPLGGDPIHRLKAELEQRGIWKAPPEGGFRWPRRGE